MINTTPHPTVRGESHPGLTRTCGGQLAHGVFQGKEILSPALIATNNTTPVSNDTGVNYTGLRPARRKSR